MNDSDIPSYDPQIFQLGIPILGICYGLQLINKHFGGTVEKKQIREDGQFPIRVDLECELFAGLGDTQEVLLTHGDSVSQLADSLKVTAQSGELIAAIAHKEKRIFGVQFHPEVELTENGKIMLRNFLCNVSHIPCSLFLLSSVLLDLFLGAWEVWVYETLGMILRMSLSSHLTAVSLSGVRLSWSVLTGEQRTDLSGVHQTSSR